MKTYVLLLRGINVGGRNSLPMKELTEVLDGLGCQDLRTYIQSGNVVMAAPPGDARTLAEKITGEIHRCRGFEPHVLVVEGRAFQRAAAANPFPEAESEPKLLHLGFLDAAADDADLERLEGLRKESERFHLEGRTFYLHAPDGVGRSKLASGAEKALGVPTTFRNWRTVTKLLELMDT